MGSSADDDDKPECLPITQTDVKKALAFRTFWIVLHVVYMSNDNRRKRLELLGWW